MRPGNLSSFSGFTPKAAHRRRNTSFGFFGKSAMLPTPGPAPAGAPKGTKIIADAYNIKTKDFYAQDPRCPNVGERMFMCSEKTHVSAGCKVSECCDIIWGPPFCIQDCGPDVPVECDDDTDYIEFPEQAWSHCGQVIAAFKAKGIPADYAERICADEDLPDNAAELAKERASATSRRPAGSSPRNSKGGCNTSHKPVRDAVGDYCMPCPHGKLWNGSACQTPLPPCDCNLPRKGAFGPCPPVPPSKCGPAPKHQKCLVKGWGPALPVCKCNKWMCPNIRDLMMKKRSKRAAIRPKIPKLKAKPKPKVIAKPKPLAGLGEATLGVIPKILVASLLLGPVFYILGRKFIKTTS